MNTTTAGFLRTSIFELKSCLFRSFQAEFNNQSTTFYNFQSCAPAFSKSEATKWCNKLGMKVPVPKTLADVEFIQNANCLYHPTKPDVIIDVSTIY